MGVFSCHQEDFSDVCATDNAAVELSGENEGYTVDTSVFENVPEYYIADDGDLFDILSVYNQKKEEKFLSENILFNDDECVDLPVQSRSSVTTDTAWVYKCVANDPAEEGAYFKAKFDSKMVAAINSKVIPEYKISTGTTYCCVWELMVKFFNLNPEESIIMVNSPLCGLHPDTKSDYWSRGYKKMPEIVSSNGKKQVQLWSYRVRILYKDVKNPTYYLDIYWPAEILDEPYRGYQFIYRKLVRN